MVEFHLDAAGGVLTCRFSGDMNSTNCAEADRIIDEKLAEVFRGTTLKAGPSFRIVFDLKGVEYASSTFIRVVVKAAKRVQKGNFTITNPTQFIADLFKTVGLDKWLDRSTSIERLLHETRVLPPAALLFDRGAHQDDAGVSIALQRLSQQPGQVLGRAGQLALGVDRALEDRVLVGPPLLEMVCRRQVERQLQLPGQTFLGTPTADKPAIIWEGEPITNGSPEVRVLTYRQLHREVCLFANVLKRNGVRKGDRVIIYLPMTPEAAVAMLACARLGAIHSVVFGGFSAQSVAERVKDCEAKVIVTADGSYRRGADVSLKQNVDEALQTRTPTGAGDANPAQVIVLRRANNEIHIQEGRDVWWHRELEYVDTNCPAREVGQRASAVHSVHQRQHGQTEGCVAYHSGLLAGRVPDHQIRLRFEGGGHLLVHR